MFITFTFALICIFPAVSSFADNRTEATQLVVSSYVNYVRPGATTSTTIESEAATNVGSSSGYIVSREEAAELYAQFGFLVIFERVTFSMCYEGLFFSCIPALNGTAANSSSGDGGWRGKWEAASVACFTSFCLCLPGGVVVNSSLLSPFPHCLSNRPTSQAQMCAVYESCVPLGDQCVAEFVITPGNLPPQCTPFLQCTGRSDVRHANYAECLEERQRDSPRCDHESTCRMVRKTPPDSQPSAYSDYTFAMALGAGSLMLVLVAMIVKRRHDALQMRMILQAEVRWLARRAGSRARRNTPWYGMLSGLVVGGGADNNAASPASKCVLCGRAPPDSAIHQPFVLLPCRCEWCGCQQEEEGGENSSEAEKCQKSSVGSRLAAILQQGREEDRHDGRATEPKSRSDTDDDIGGSDEELLCRCGQCVSHVADLRKLIVAHGDQEQAARAAEDDGNNEDIEMLLLSGHDHQQQQQPHRPSDDGRLVPLCCVCLDRAVAVAFFPCGHVACCCSCGRRIADSTGKCPLCRAEVAFAAVIGEDMLSLPQPLPSLPRDGGRAMTVDAESL